MDNQSEVLRHIINFSSHPDYRATMDKKTAKKLLEVDFVFCNGDIRDIKVKHKGLGVYSVSTEPRFSHG